MRAISNEAAQSRKIVVTLKSGPHKGKKARILARHGSPHRPYSATMAIAYDLVLVRDKRQVLRLPGRDLQLPTGVAGKSVADGCVAV